MSNVLDRLTNEELKHNTAKIDVQIQAEGIKELEEFSKEFLGKGDKVLLIDDFLANGKALEGLATLVQDSGAELVGAGVVIEKGFQIGGKLLRDRGIHLESLAIVDGMDDKTGEITFRKQ